jgi:hypothetical protein
MAEVDIAKIDGDLLGITTGLGSQFLHIASHQTILPPSRWMVYGARRRRCKCRDILDRGQMNCSQSSNPVRVELGGSQVAPLGYRWLGGKPTLKT